MADKLEIPDVDEDFGQTLAVWGVPSGPYLVLPFFGPRYLRGTSSFVVDRAVDPQTYVGGDARLPLIVLDTVNTRAEFLGQDDFLEMQIDSYIFLRESYQQRRQLEIQDTADNRLMNSMTSLKKMWLRHNDFIQVIAICIKEKKTLIEINVLS